MNLVRYSHIVLFFCLCAGSAFASSASGPIIQSSASPKSRSGPGCVSASEAAQHPDKDTCILAHVYDVVELPDGTRFLDICPPDQADAECRFTVVNPYADRTDVGDLSRLRDHDVQIRGVVRTTHGRMGIVLSHVRQFSGGPEKFRPNPKLLHGFAGEDSRSPVRDPNLAAGGRHRSFMDRKDTESVPAAKK